MRGSRAPGATLRGVLPAFALIASAVACGALPGGDTGHLVCSRVPVQGTEPPGQDPDFTRYGFPVVAATQRFTPGRETVITAGRIRVVLPPNFYTDPLTFELLVADEAVWQTCAPPGRQALAPYAFRVTDPATGARVGRFDNPAMVEITDPRATAGAVDYLTSPTAPPTADPSSREPAIDGTTLRLARTSARVGWFITVPAP